MSGSTRPAAASEASAADRALLVRQLAQCSLLTGLSDEDVAEVAALSRLRAVPAQTDIFTEGQPSGVLWVLLAGRVRLYHSAADGRQQVVSFRAPVSVLELGPALDGRAYTATATALDEVVLAMLPRSTLATLSRRFPVTIRNVIDQLCLELRQRDIATGVATLKDARGRVGCALLQLSEQFGLRSNGSVRINYRLTRQDVADISGVTLETAIRVLSDFQRQGILRTQAQIIEILDEDALRDPTACEECQFDCSVFGNHRNGSRPH